MRERSWGSAQRERRGAMLMRKRRGARVYADDAARRPPDDAQRERCSVRRDRRCFACLYAFSVC